MWMTNHLGEPGSLTAIMSDHFGNVYL